MMFFYWVCGMSEVPQELSFPRRLQTAVSFAWKRRVFDPYDSTELK